MITFSPFTFYIMYVTYCLFYEKPLKASEISFAITDETNAWYCSVAHTLNSVSYKNPVKSKYIQCTKPYKYIECVYK